MNNKYIVDKINSIEKGFNQSQSEILKLLNGKFESTKSIKILERELNNVRNNLIKSNNDLQFVLRDIKSIRNELKKSNSKLKTYNDQILNRNHEINSVNDYIDFVFSTINGSLVLLDEQFKIKKLNLSFCDEFNIDFQSYYDIKLHEIDNGVFNDLNLIKRLNVTLSKKSSFKNHTLSYQSTVGTKYYLVNGSYFYINTSKIQLILLSLIDITQIKDNEKKLLRAKNKAEKFGLKIKEVLNAKQLFFNSMSHEIRTPLNSIIGFTNLLAKTNLSDDQKKFLSAIQISGSNLNLLIDDILDIAKVESGKLTLEKNNLNIYDLLEKILNTFLPKLQQKKIRLLKDIDHKIPKNLIGDHLRLNQIILNIVSNAVKFTKENGEIRIQIKLISINNYNCLIKFIISDNGIGISKDKINTIFNGYQHASSDTYRKFGGTGLGLTITKKLVDAHNGKINVKSKLNSGSQFEFIIPFELNQNNIPSHNLFQNDSNHSDTILSKLSFIPKVLIVEDMRLNQFLIESLLNNVGISFEIANDGKTAIDKLKVNNYDLILMDLQMPVMNGFETTSYIRNNLKLSTPIIALTANVTSADINKCKEIGMDDYIAKPLNENEFYSKLNGLIVNSSQIHV